MNSMSGGCGNLISPLAKSFGCISEILFSVLTDFSLALPIHYSCLCLRFSHPHSHRWPSNIGWKEGSGKKWGKWDITEENLAKGCGGTRQWDPPVDDEMQGWIG